jgi:dipeptidase D
VLNIFYIIEKSGDSKMKYILDHERKPNFKFFEEISAIPRNSFQEQKISDYLVKFAEDRNLWCYRDGIWNVIIKKPASKGYEDHSPVILQGHTDMVCEKVPGSAHDFDTDPLELYVEDGWLKAKGTTLGADCGDGVASMLAVLDDTTLEHPPIEAFFSVQEESGIGGPRLVDYSKFTAKRIIATDIIWEGTTYESVSGAIGGDFIKKINRKNTEQPVFELTVSNCTGGHSALNAAKCPANAIKAVARILFRIKKAVAINLIDLEGGTIRNNIASDCRAVFAYKEENKQEIKNLIQEVTLELEREYSFTDPEMKISLAELSDHSEALDEESSDCVIDLIHVLPSGAYIRNPKFNASRL